MSQPMQQVWNWNSFTGGEGDGFYYGPQGGYRVSSNLETRMLENGMRISQKKTDTGQSYVGDILAVNQYADRCFSTEDGNTGKLYYQGIFKFNLATGTTAWNKINAFGKLQRNSNNIIYSYGITQTNNGVGKIHRIDTDFSGISYSVGTFTLAGGRTNNDLYMPVLSEPSRIVFAYGNTIFEFDSNEVVTELYSFPIDYTIVGITKYQDTYKIYYNSPNYNSGPASGNIVNWSGSAEEFESISPSVTYVNSPIITVINDGAYDYAVFGDNITSDIYYVGGLDRGQPLRVNTELNPNVNQRLFGKQGFIREGVLYITGENKLGESCIYTYGSYYPGTGKSLVSSQILQDGYNSVRFVPAVQNTFLYDNGKIWNINFLYGTAPNEQGICISYPITGALGGYSIKTIDRIDIWYNLLHPFNFIRIYARKNGGPETMNTEGWNLIKTIDDNTKRGVRIERGELLPLGLGDFYQLEFKVELNSGGSNKSPVFHNLRLLYKDNIKD